MKFDVENDVYNMEVKSGQSASFINLYGSGSRECSSLNIIKPT